MTSFALWSQQSLWALGILDMSYGYASVKQLLGVMGMPQGLSELPWS